MQDNRRQLCFINKRKTARVFSWKKTTDSWPKCQWKQQECGDLCVAYSFVISFFKSMIQIRLRGSLNFIMFFFSMKKITPPHVIVHDWFGIAEEYVNIIMITMSAKVKTGVCICKLSYIRSCNWLLPENINKLVTSWYSFTQLIKISFCFLIFLWRMWLLIMIVIVRLCDKVDAINFQIASPKFPKTCDHFNKDVRICISINSCAKVILWPLFTLRK